MKREVFRGDKVISISVDADEWESADLLAKKLGITRPIFVRLCLNEGLEKYRKWKGKL